MTSRVPTRGRGFVAAAAALVIMAVTGGLLIMRAVTGSQAAPPAAPGFEASAGPSPQPVESRPSPSPTTQRRPATLRRSEPTRIRIPSIEVDSTFVALGLDQDRRLETPTDPDQVGWFTDAASPGVPGVAVVAGHVTWNREPTVFHRLGRLERGARIEIDRADGSVVIFAATRRDTFPQQDFPTGAVYRRTERPELVLITCGGRYDSDDHAYDSNVVVWAELVDSRPGPSR